jgi:PucR family transcriptional regulator, purine catabolism regulatory protein
MSDARDREAAHAASRSLREAELLRELGPAVNGHEQTYRLLVGVLLRDPGELEGLRAETVSPLMTYDSEHGTELVETLRVFLINDGSTSETAVQMRLHRHTVGYRLARVYEVSGLSPYESDGRERLSLGLKADQILSAHERVPE